MQNEISLVGGDAPPLDPLLLPYLCVSLAKNEIKYVAWTTIQSTEYIVEQLILCG